MTFFRHLVFFKIIYFSRFTVICLTSITVPYPEKMTFAWRFVFYTGLYLLNADTSPIFKHLPVA